jgi:hypothetical protein
MSIIIEPGVQRRSFRSIAQYSVATVCGLAFGTTVQVFLYSLVRGDMVGARDFAVYWATGQQVAHHLNPYDAGALLRIEHAAGLIAPHGVMFMRNLPWTLPLVFPLGFIGLWIGWALWSLLLLACLLFSVHSLWVMHGRPDNRRHFVGYSFGPALICLIDGQCSLLALVGLVLFLRFNRTKPFLAGMSLWLCALKPHLFVPFGLVFFAWVIVSKNLRVLSGLAVALSASVAITFCIDPAAWGQYLHMLHTSGIERDPIPCISFLLRYWISLPTVWLQYVLPVCGCAWALKYFWSRRFIWDWTKHGSLLILVSILAAPYSWLYDQVLAIPALMEGAYRSRSRNMVIALAFASALVEVALVGTYWRAYAVYLWTLWTAPAWLVWYLLATRPNSNELQRIRGSAVISDKNFMSKSIEGQISKPSLP